MKPPVDPAAAVLMPSVGEGSVDACTGLDELAAVIVEQRAVSYRAEVALLAAAAKWAGMIEPVSLTPQVCGDRMLQLGGDGVEPCSEYAPDEFGALMGISTDSAKSYLAEALELQLRLPRTWARITAGDLAPWRGRIIARATMNLSPTGATEVDRQISWCAERVGPTQLARIVEAAAIKLDDGHTPKPEVTDPRHVAIRHGDHDQDGHTWLDACIDVEDGIDLENALRRRAAHARHLGSDASLDVRRAWALGDIARADLTLDLIADQTPDGDLRDEPVVTPAAPSVELRVHVMASELEAFCAGDDEDPTYARIETTKRLITLDALKNWITRTGADIKIRPVIDTDANLHTTRYEIPARIRAQIEERDPTCVFPWCSRPASRADIDHITPYGSGETETTNLAPLCRHHHRTKTHAGWTYTHIEPAVFLWQSPGGDHWLRDSTGTRRT